MNKLKKLILGAAAVGVLFGMSTLIRTVPAHATALRTLVLTTLTATTGTITTLTSTTLSATTGTIPTLSSSVSFKGPSVSTETITAGGTITANACGGIKRVTAASAVTTDTTNSFTAPSTAGVCDMLVVNVGSAHITIDGNSLFPTKNSANITLEQNGSIRVISDGSYWWHGSWTEY